MKELPKKVVSMGNINTSVLLTMNPASERALIERRGTVDFLANEFKSMGQNAAKGVEQLFPGALFWALKVPKSYMLAKSFEWFKAAGFLSYSNQFTRLLPLKNWLEKGRREAKETKGPYGHLGLRDSHEHDMVGLSDSLLAECFMVFCYGLIYSVIGSSLEILLGVVLDIAFGALAFGCLLLSGRIQGLVRNKSNMGGHV